MAVNYNNGDRVAWSYDAFHRRVKQTDTTAAGVVVHDLIWEGLGLIESRASQSGTPGEVRRYYGNGEKRLPAGGGVTRLYYTTDHLGSIRELVDAAGAVRARYDYDPYGNRTKQPGGDLDADFGYTRHYTHAASGLVLAPFRGYDPGTGRWLNRDPIEEEGGINLYGYVGNSPINNIDRFGLEPVPYGSFFNTTCGLGAGIFQLTFGFSGDSNGQSYVSPGFSIGLGLPFSFSATMNQFNEKDQTSINDPASFLKEASITTTAACLLARSYTVVPDNRTAIGKGVGSPGIGIGWSWGFLWNKYPNNR